jgi:DnaD/phage-associated family protein
MPKDVYYFPHDYNARNDPKLARLLFARGPSGIGVYWCLVEMLYEQGGTMPITDIPIIAQQLRTRVKIVEDVVNNFGLFQVSDQLLSSSSVFRRLSSRIARSDAARESALAGVRKRANAERTLSDGTARKERKVKDKKEDISPSSPPAAAIIIRPKKEGDDLTEKTEGVDLDPKVADVAKCYEANVGILTPMVSEHLKDIATEYPVEWFTEAVKVACDANVRNLKYIESIMGRWKVDGFKADRTPRGTRKIVDDSPVEGMKIEY